MNLYKALPVLVWMSFFAMILTSAKREPITIACVGDSVTFGARLEVPDRESYPARLQQLVGKGYRVLNMGVGGCTLIRKGRPTVWDELDKIRKANPDQIIISLGINDTCGEGTCGDRKCWEYRDEFLADYLDLIDSFQVLPKHPQIWICAPSPMVLETPGLSQARIEGLTIRKPRLQELISLVKQVAEEKQVGFIDLNSPLDHRKALYTVQDGVHPNAAGYLAIAELVFEEIKD
jgi:lysophospholipase L1-like esterase